VSGFFGSVRFDGRPVDESLLRRVADCLSFRGGDGTSVCVRNGIGGCSTLMRIPGEPQALRQPASSADRYLLWGDVRLDGREVLREQLSDKKRDPSSEHLLLSAWERWGEDALAHLLGDFSFALWDEREEVLHCARDFIGTRPFYYAHGAGALYFGNTLGVFAEVRELSRELDEIFVADFLASGVIADLERTIYRSIRRLPAGHSLKFAAGGLQVRRFYTLPIEEPLTFSRSQEYLDAYVEVLRTAVRDRLPQGNAALYLSGGLDSGSVCAVAGEIAAECGGKKHLKAFTLSWQRSFDDPEPQFAKLSARHIGIAHEVLIQPKYTPLTEGDPPSWNTPEPDPDAFFESWQMHFQDVAVHSNVVISGDGGDDVLMGQSWPYLVQLWRERNWQRLAQDFGGYLWTHGRLPPLRAGLRAKLRGLLRREDQYAGFPRWLNPGFEAKLHLKQRWTERTNPTVPEHPHHPRAYQALHSGYWADVLEREDAGWNGVRLEARAPLLDLRVLRFMLRIPPVPWCMNKELARKAIGRRLPQPVVDRPKTPLPRDPISLCAKPLDWPERFRGGWGPIEMFVNWTKWCETLNEPQGSLSWLSIRPISLLCWLKAVENRMGIK